MSELEAMISHIVAAQRAHERAGNVSDGTGWVAFCACGRGFYDSDLTMAGNRWRVHQAVQRGEQLPVGLAGPI